MAEAVRIVCPVPFQLESVNAWLFPGEQPALVDCGLGRPESYELVRGAVQQHVEDPSRLVLYITHGHVDHAGNAKRLKRDLGVKLAAPREEAPYVETFRRDSDDRNDDFADGLRAHGMPDELVRKVRARSGDIDHWTEDANIDVHLADGEKVVLGDDEATVVMTPGHTPGSTSFLLHDHRMLTGDTLLEDITSNAIELRDVERGAHERYVRTIEAMRRFVGCHALPGHLDAFPITEDVLDRHMDRHRKRANAILNRLDRPRTAWSLMPAIFPTLPKDQVFLAMSELVGNLHTLEAQGRAKERLQDGVWRYKAA